MIEHIYAIRNKINNNVYVGRTQNDIAVRFECHLSRLRKDNHSSRKLKYDFDMFGESNFYIELIEDADTEIVAEIEEYWIEKFYKVGRCLNNRLPYNKYKKTQNKLEEFLKSLDDANE